jgi:hypothetical protein
VLYNVLGFLCYLSTSSASGRALSDFGVAQVSLVGQSHTKLTTIYVGVRDNGPITGLVSATLTVNGSIALYQGVGVVGTITVTSSGGIAWLTLTWQAPAGGPFTLNVIVSSPYVVSFNGLDDQMPLSPLNLPTTFS